MSSAAPQTKGKTPTRGKEKAQETAFDLAVLNRAAHLMTREIATLTRAYGRHEEGHTLPILPAPILARMQRLSLARSEVEVVAGRIRKHGTAWDIPEERANDPEELAS